MEIGICTSLEKAADLAGAGVDLAGVDFIEEHVQRFLVPELGDDEFAKSRELALNSPVPPRVANCFLPGKLKCVGPEVKVNEARILQYAETAFARAAEVGIDTIVFGSGGSRKVPDGFPKAEAVRQLVELLTKLAPLAAKRGVTVVVEPLASADCNFVNSLAEGAEVVEAVGHESVRLLADTYHMLRDGEGPEAIAKHGRLLRHCHVAEIEGRACPGTHGEDLTPYYRALKSVGYEGRLSMECSWKDMASECAGAVGYIKARLAEAGY